MYSDMIKLKYKCQTNLDDKLVLHQNYHRCINSSAAPYKWKKKKYAAETEDTHAAYVNLLQSYLTES